MTVRMEGGWVSEGERDFQRVLGAGLEKEGSSGEGERDDIEVLSEGVECRIEGGGVWVRVPRREGADRRSVVNEDEGLGVQEGFELEEVINAGWKVVVEDDKVQTDVRVDGEEGVEVGEMVIGIGKGLWNEGGVGFDVEVNALLGEEVDEESGCAAAHFEKVVGVGAGNEGGD